MTRTHLQTDEHQLHVALQELIGGCAPPDLRARIRDATPAERRAAGARVSFARRPHPRLLAAAVLLLGCTAVVGALLLRDDATDEATGQDPRPERIVRPLSFDEFDALLDDVQAITVRARRPGALTPIAIPAIAESSRTIHDRAVVDDLVAGMRLCTERVPGARWSWSNELVLHLSNGRFVRASYIGPGASDAPRLAVEGLARDTAMSAELEERLEPIVHDVTRAAMHAGGVVLDDDDYRALVESPRAATMAQLHLLSARGGLPPSLERFEQLRVLTVHHWAPDIGADDAATLAGLQHLEELRLHATSLGDEDVALLAGLQRLRVLDLSLAGVGDDTRFDGTGFTACASHRSLVELRMDHCVLTTAGLRAIAGIPELRKLRMRKLHDRQLGAARGQEAQGAHADLAALQNARHLEHLDLSDSEAGVDAALPALARLPRLRELLLDSTDVSSRGIAALAACRTLERLDVAYATDPDLIPSIAQLRRLRHLRLSFCSAVDDGALDALLPLVDLRHLELTGCRQLTDAAIDTLSKMSLLTRLDLRGCDAVREDPERRVVLQRALPQCDILW